MKVFQFSFFTKEISMRFEIKQIYLGMLSVLFLVVLPYHSFAQRSLQTNHPANELASVRLVGTTPVIDGVLDYEVRSYGAIISNFGQIQSIENSPPTENTPVQIVYDDNTVYAGVMRQGAGKDRCPPRPCSRVEMRISPTYSWSHNDAQFVTHDNSGPSDRRYTSMASWTPGCGT